MQRDPLASLKARKAERKADERSGLITIKPVKLDSQPTTTAGGGGGGFRKGAFKSAFEGVGRGDGVGVGEGENVVVGGGSGKVGAGEEGVEWDTADGEVGESESEDEGDGFYDPRRPTGCFEGCPGR